MPDNVGGEGVTEEEEPLRRLPYLTRCDGTAKADKKRWKGRVSWAPLPSNDTPLRVSRLSGMGEKTCRAFPDKGSGQAERRSNPALSSLRQPNGLMRQVYDRMAVILNRADYQQWLDPQAKGPALQSLLRPLREDALEMYPVNPAIVNSGRIDCPECVVPWVG
jgi:SOS response associated peptidase (SRAP)